jgi:DNA mismatch repair ATPase MutS
LQEGHFTFAEFIDDTHVACQLYEGWIPLITTDEVVHNSLTLGLRERTKLVITGPNGCGKSTFLKALGQAAVLAHSWGIVPAEEMKITPLSGIRTCFSPEEDLHKGLSTFMAVDNRMQAIKKFITEHMQPTLVLIDEPWRGTVDEASAEYIYAFGKEIAETNSMLCIATHVKKPIELEAVTDDFKNMHVAMHEHSDGLFERIFKLQDGPAYWWFDDAAKRGRFINWLRTTYKN